MQQIKRTQLDPQSFEWGQVDYQLQIATGKSSLKLLTIHKYSDNNSQLMDYKPTHSALINTTDFSGQYKQKLINKQLSLQDVIFKCGHINIQKFLNNQHKLLTFLICKVNLGKIGLGSAQDVTECDSIFIQPQTQEDVFQFNYFLRTNNQYSVLYEVTFTTSEDKEFKITDFQCSSCENRIPTVYCATESLFFCETCCAQHHKSKLMASHVLEQVNKVNTLGYCKSHNRKFQFYCTKCSKYLCHHCTQKGIHHQNNQHPFKLVSDLYNQKHNTMQQTVKRPKDKLNSLTTNLNIKRKQIQDNYNSTKQTITKKYEKALEVLNQIYYQKCQVLTSCEVEIKMLTERIQWSKAFVVFQEKNLKPMYYFQSQKKFQYQISRLNVQDFQGIFMTKPDVKVQGDLVVGTKDNIDLYRKKLQMQTEKALGTTQNQNEYERKFARAYQQNPTKEKPKIGDLSLMLQNSNLKFFQMVTNK